MKIYDISQEVFGCQVYPGDPMPEKKEIKSMFHCYLYDLIHANFEKKLKKILIYD